MKSLRKAIRQNDFTQSMFYSLGIDKMFVKMDMMGYSNRIKNSLNVFRGGGCG